MSHIFKEEDAGIMICPIMTSGADGTTPVMCMGSKCAGWRWSRSKHTEAFTKEVLKRIKAKYKTVEDMKKDMPDWGKEWQSLLSEIKIGKHPGFENTEGYCGPAGDPSATLRG